MSTGLAAFQTTNWSVILKAGQGSEAALTKLCQLYWQPLYAYIRHRGQGVQSAQDLTQSFFIHLLEHDAFRGVAPAKGRFRSFLLASVRHFLANEWNRGQTQKRGGGVLTIALDSGAAEGRYSSEPNSKENPEKLYEKTVGRGVARSSNGKSAPGVRQRWTARPL